MERQKLGKGPNLPNFLEGNDELKSENFCTVSINRTNFMAIAYQPNYHLHGHPKSVAMVDFNKQIWTSYPSIQLEEFVLSCSGAVQFDKKGKRYLNRKVMTH